MPDNDAAGLMNNTAVPIDKSEIDGSIEELYLPVVEDDFVVDKYVVVAVVGLVFAVVVVVVVVVVVLDTVEEGNTILVGMTSSSSS